MHDNISVHPGEILRELLDLNGMGVEELASDIGVPRDHLDAVIGTERNVSADLALKLSVRFGTTPHYWLVVQNAHDLSEAQRENRGIVSKIVSTAPRGMAIETALGDGGNAA